MEKEDWFINSHDTRQKMRKPFIPFTVLASFLVFFKVWRKGLEYQTLQKYILRLQESGSSPPLSLDHLTLQDVA